jgi:hypothetical protein
LVSSFRRRSCELPDTATWKDLAYTLALIEDIEVGLAESDAGLGVDTATLRKRFGIPG